MFPETAPSKEPGESLENEELRVTGVRISRALTPGSLKGSEALGP